MKNIFEQLNDETIDLEEFDNDSLTDLEKKKAKKRIKAKLNSRKNSRRKKKIVAMAAALVMLIFVGTNTNFALADIPIIGNTIEKFVYSKEHSLKDYKTVIGESVVNKGTKVTLNEVVLDEDQLIISSTFHSDFLVEEQDFDYNWFTRIDVYINGIEAHFGGGGGPEEMTPSSLTYLWAANLENVNLEEEQRIKIVFNQLERSDSEKLIKGKWSFEFTASGEKLMSERKTIPITKEFTLENGQNVMVDELILTPISTKLNYRMDNISDLDVLFKFEDQNGEELQWRSGSSMSTNNDNRLVAVESHVTKLKIIPIVYSDNKLENETVLYEEAFEVDIK